MFERTFLLLIPQTTDTFATSFQLVFYSMVRCNVNKNSVYRINQFTILYDNWPAIAFELIGKRTTFAFYDIDIKSFT